MQTFLKWTILFSFISANGLAKDNEKIPGQKLVALTEIVPHASLEQAKAGVLAKLQAEGYIDGKNLKLVEENAQGNIATANLIAKKFVGMNPDLIVTISTPSTQAVKQAVKSAAKKSTIPIVFVSVSDPVAAGLVDNLAKPHDQITGAMDSPLVQDVQVLIRTFIPKAKKLGVVFNASEANSVKAVADLKASLDPSLKLIESNVTSSNLVPDAVRSIIKNVDALYIPSDNMVVSALPKLIQIANANKVPTFSSDPEHILQGAFASYGYSQYAVGQTAGAMAARILRGEKAAAIRISTPSAAEVSVNERTAKVLNIAVPKEFNKMPIKLVK